MQWVVVLFIIVVVVVSAIAQTVRNQQEKAPPPRRRSNRPAAERERSSNGGSSDMDRFLQEIEKLRKRSADGGDEPRRQKPGKQQKSVPTVAPAKKPKRQESIPKVSPAPRVEQLPAATVLPSPAAAFPAAPFSQHTALAADSPIVSRAPKPVGTTPFAKSLLGVLGNKQAMPLAIVLQEVLGPPKCQQRPGNT